MTRYLNHQPAALLVLIPLLTLFSCTVSPTAAPVPTLAAQVNVSPANYIAPHSFYHGRVRHRGVNLCFASGNCNAYHRVRCNSASDSSPPASTIPPQTSVVTPTIVIGSGDFVYPDPTVGLTDLPSYKATLTIGFDGTSDGKPDKWSETYVMLVSKSPAFRHALNTNQNR